jgi:hypothetical protein
MVVQEFLNKFMEETPDTMLWKESAINQMVYIRDLFPSLFGCGVEVISTHTSKSVKLPVYRAVTKQDFDIIMRGNFYDWKVSVKLYKGLPFSFEQLCRELCTDGIKNIINRSYFEGFKDEWIYSKLESKYDEKYNGYRTNKEFSIELPYREESLFTFLFLLKNGNILK